MATKTTTNTLNWPETLQEAVIYFADPDRCLEAAISLRWQGPVTCPTCGSTDVHFISTRRVWRCKAKQHTRQQFSVKIGTVMEDSPITLDKWMVAIWLLSAAKNGISSYELGRAIGITQKSAWFMLHRIRLAMQNDNHGPFSGNVEADETFIGGAARFMHHNKKMRVTKGRSGKLGKTIVFGLLERNTPKRKSRVKMAVIPERGRFDIQGQLRKNIVWDKDQTTLHTDEWTSYQPAMNRHSWDFDGTTGYEHKVINHAETYVMGNVHTNGMENFWALLKRTIRGTYVSIEPFHLFRYLDEQAFRFNERGMTDSERFAQVGKQVVGKRLTYRALTGADFPESHAG
jgi:transposase-like protein